MEITNRNIRRPASKLTLYMPNKLKHNRDNWTFTYRPRQQVDVMLLSQRKALLSSSAPMLS